MIVHHTMIARVVLKALLCVDGALWKTCAQGKQIVKSHTLGTDGSATAAHAYLTSLCSNHTQLLHL